MAKIASTLTEAISYLNTLLELDQTPPTSGEEDYIVWKNLLNLGIDLWQNEDGITWRELFGKLSAAADGDKTTTTATSYAVPTNFRSPASAYVWLGTGTTKTPYKVIRQEEVQLYETDGTGHWCYFLLDGSPTLEFNPNLTIAAGQTISYMYYKWASAVSSGSDTFEMSDPMYAVYYALAILTKEEGNQLALSIAEQKMEAMKTRNQQLPEFQTELDSDPQDTGFGV